MICGVLASASAPTQALSSPFSKPRSSSFFSASSSSSGKVHTDLKLKSVGFYGRKGSQRSIVHCSSSAGPGGPGFGRRTGKSEKGQKESSTLDCGGTRNRDIHYRRHNTGRNQQDVTAVSSTTTTTIVTPVNQSSTEPAPLTTKDKQDPADDDMVLWVPIDD